MKLMESAVHDNSTRSERKCKCIIDERDRIEVDAELSGCRPERLSSIKMSIT